MTDRKRISRITALLLTAVMFLSALSFYADAVYAEDPAAPVMPEVKLSFVRKSGRELTLEWTGPAAFPEGLSIDHCYIFKRSGNGSEEITELSLEESAGKDKMSYTYTGLEYSTEYTFRTEYRVRYSAEDVNETSEAEVTVKSDDLTVRSAVEPPVKRVLGSFTIKDPPRLLHNGAAYNLRKYANEEYYGYAIVQGSCVDNQGKYAYYCLVDSGSYGKIVKVRMSDNARVAVSKKYRFAHGNGMCFDSKRNRVVVVSYDNYRNTLTFVDPDDLNNICQKNVSSAAIRKKISRNNTGITALAYNAKYDCYVAMQKTAHNVIIYDAETLKAKAAALTVFESRYTGTFQSIDSDDTYVYFLLSPDEGDQPYNVLIAFDWHAEKYQNLLDGNSSEDVWMCGNGDGKHSAVIRITGASEIESLYHMDAGGGRGHFYLTNYFDDPKYDITKKKVKWKKVGKKVKVKVKWKKVWKKVKWKKVKTKSGKTKWKYRKKKVWKYKYKYKTKKVWKYRTKKVKTFKNYNRDNYVLDLGVF